MKSQKRESFEKWVNKELKKYQRVLLLQSFNVELEKKELGKDSILEVTVRYPYKNINVYYDSTALKEFKRKNHGELKQAIIHELCHAITEPLYLAGINRHATEDQIENEREMCTDHIANIVAHLV